MFDSIIFISFNPNAVNLHKERMKSTLRHFQSVWEYLFLHFFYVCCLSTSSPKKVSVFTYLLSYYKRLFSELFDMGKHSTMHVDITTAIQLI